jgi:hypothetical protein
MGQGLNLAPLKFAASKYISAVFYLIYSIPIYGLNASGITTLPSFC